MKIKKNIVTTLKNEFFQGSIILTATSFGVNGMNYLFNIIVARQLGPAVFGDLVAMFSYLVVISIPVNIMSIVVIQRIADAGKHRISYAKAVEMWLYRRLSKWWFIIALAIFSIPIIPVITNLSYGASTTLIFILLFSLIGGFYDGVLQGGRLFTAFAIISLVTIAIKLSGALFLYTAVGSYEVLLVMLVVSGIIKITLSKSRLATTPSDKHIHINKRFVKIIQNKTVMLTGMSLLGITIIGNADIMIVKKIFSSTDAGIYASWSLLAKIIMYAAGSLLSISFIFFSSADQKKYHNKIFAYSLAFVFLISLSSIVFYSFAGETVVKVFFGDAFSDVVQFLPLAGLFGSGYLLIFYINHYFISQKSKYALIAPIIAPIYILALLLNTQSLKSIMHANIAITLVLVILYLTFVISTNKPSILSHEEK